MRSATRSDAFTSGASSWAAVTLLAALASGQTQSVSESIHYVRPGEDPQAILDASQAGDRLVFLPGIHEHPLGRHQAILYVDKSIDIVLMGGAVLRLADKQTVLEATPEITIDHGAPKRLDDFSVGGNYGLGLGPTIFTIHIDGTGRGVTPDTFAWGAGRVRDLPHSSIPITGDWQTLSNGVEIKFAATRGHNVGSWWIVSYDGQASYGIRVGHGVQRDYIEDVRIVGRGTIDMNRGENVQPSQFVKDISACVLLHGRVRNVAVEGITMVNTMRSVMAYGEHTGKFLRGGGTDGGESFDAEKISIVGTRTINPGDKGYLIGHPSHRGRISNVRCNYNYMETGTTSLEPNFNLSQYEVIGNVIKSGGRAIHCWRKSVNGLIKNNVRIDDTTGLEVVMVNSPGAWEDPQNLIIRDNRNHLSDRLGSWASVTAGIDNQAIGEFSSVAGGRRNTADANYASIAGGHQNRATGVASAVTGGTGNLAAAHYSRTHGVDARSYRAGEDVLASGAFEVRGDAQASRLVAKGTSDDNKPIRLVLVEGEECVLPADTSASYRIVAVARGSSGLEHAAFIGTGLIHRKKSGATQLLGNTMTPVYRSHPELNLEVLVGSGPLRLQARGMSGKAIRWVAQIEIVEVRF